MKLFTAILCFSIPFSATIAQNQAQKSNWTANKPYELAVFVKNEGQFNVNEALNEYIGDKNNKIHYVASKDYIDFIFTSSGLVYHYFEAPKREEGAEEREREERERKREEKEEFPKGTAHFLRADWLGANSNAEVIAENKVESYFTYPNPKGGTIKANAFKKITYKNVYPFTDVEYTFDENKNGIKYNIILHAGANPNLINIKYNGAKNVTKESNGDITISSEFGNFKELAPVSFDDDGKAVNSAFVLNKNTLCFAFDKQALTSEGLVPQGNSLIIDPWVVTPIFADSFTNKVFEIGKDCMNNVYIFGGLGNACVQKYNVAGALQWTYSTFWPGVLWYGDMAVSFNGLVYVTGESFLKIDNTGNLLWSLPNGAIMPESFRFTYNYDYSKLLVAQDGGRDSVYTIDVAANTIGAATATGNIASNGEIRALVKGFNGNFYGLTIDGVPQLIALSGAFAPIYSIPSGQALSYSGIQYNGWGGQNAIAADYNYIYTTNGYELFKRNINTGVVLNSTFIPGGIPEQNSGIEVDDCGNVYCGSQSKIYKFDSAFVIVDSVSTPTAVYDLTVGLNGEIFACGNEFLTSLNLAACPVTSCACASNINVNSPTIICPGDSTTLTASGANTYIWNPTTGLNTTTGATVIAKPLSNTTYTVIGTSGSCADTSTTTVTVFPDNVVDAGNDQVIALGESITLTATGSGSFLWNTGQTTTSITVNPTVTTTYYVSIIDANGCSTSDSVRVEVKSELNCNDLSVPSAFSPNGDGKNDLFVLNGWANCMSDFKMLIFNRWGQKVYESENASAIWDGKFKGKEIDLGVYVYYITAKTITGKLFTKKGNISLIK